MENQGFENGMMRLGNPATGRSSGVTHLIHPDPARLDDGPRPWCRPAYINMSNRAVPVRDGDPVTCRLCIKLDKTGKQKP